MLTTDVAVSPALGDAPYVSTGLQAPEAEYRGQPLFDLAMCLRLDAVDEAELGIPQYQHSIN